MTHIYFNFIISFVLFCKLILKEYLFLTYPHEDCNLFYCNSTAVIYFGQLFIYYIALTFIYLLYCNNIYLFILLLKIINFFLHHLMGFYSGFAFRSNRDVSFGLNKNLVRATTTNIIYCWR